MGLDPQKLRGEARTIGRYMLYGELAAGGMATVHYGRLLGPVGFSRTVAIKRLHAQFAKDPEFASMFLDEARLAARVQHPNVVSTLDVVPLDGELFLVMEYIHGQSLARISRLLRKRREQMPLPIVSAVIGGALLGLHAAHEAANEQGTPLGIVHRDVSPQNILLGTDGVSRVLDFGVAKAAGRVQSTREGQVKGKLAYMAPEQLVGDVHADRRCDIYAAAVVLWETITSRRLFDGENEGAVLTKIGQHVVEPPSQFRPEVPRELDAIVLKGLHRQRVERFSTALEMATAIENVLGIWSPRMIGEWMDSLGDPELQLRGAAVREIESISMSQALPKELAPSLHPTAVTSTRLAGDGATELPSNSLVTSPSTVLAAQKSSRRMAVAIGGVVVASVAVTAWFATHATSPEPAAAAMSAPAAPTSISKPVSKPVAVRNEKLTISPADARVDIDGVTADLVEGIAIVSGEPGSVHAVRIYKDGAEQRAQVVVTESGLVPAELGIHARPDELPPLPLEPAAAAPRHDGRRAPASSASAAAAKKGAIDETFH